MTNPAQMSPLVRKLQSIFEITEAEEAAVLSLPVILRDFKAGQDIVREKDRPTQCCAILEGFAIRYKVVEDGKRQIMSFHIAGDVPDLQSLHLDVMDHNLATLVPSKVAFITHAALRDLMTAHPKVAEAFWREALVDAAVFREWVVNIGRRSAVSRLAHLLCELFTRSDSLGLTSGAAFALPVTQQDLADAMGLSTVHVNRMMMELREAGLIKTPRGAVIIERWEELAVIGQFDPAYLHIRRKATHGAPSAHSKQAGGHL